MMFSGLGVSVSLGSAFLRMDFIPEGWGTWMPHVVAEVALSFSD